MKKHFLKFVLTFIAIVIIMVAFKSVYGQDYAPHKSDTIGVPIVQQSTDSTLYNELSKAIPITLSEIETKEKELIKLQEYIIGQKARVQAFRDIVSYLEGLWKK